MLITLGRRWQQSRRKFSRERARQVLVSFFVSLFLCFFISLFLIICEVSMRPTEVTDEQIIQAGIEIEAAQERVTGFRLRRLIGAGTPQRLNKVWETHKEKTAPAAAPAGEAPPLPGDIEPALKSLIDQMAVNLRQLVVTLNGHCQKEAMTKVVNAEREAEAKCALYLEELTDASNQIESAEGQIKSLERQGQQLSTELNAAHERIASLTGELAKATEKLERANFELNEARESEANAINASLLAEQTSQQLKREMEDAKQAHAEDVGRQQEVLAGERAKREAAESKLAQVQLTCDAVSEQLNTRTTQLAGANAKIKGLEERLSDIAIRADEQHSVILSQRQSIAHHERQIEQFMKSHQEKDASRPDRPAAEEND
ncbi:DNA-binding protein [Stutzerimonas stutzeri]|uniref:DNA-binding protein n=1 Tax=Stutzerimonas stutzeri TaxID=316 RepID=UPI0015E3E07A|nr:DNA-binding protein [Stutzerimonas stutzeri]MBA1280325.1 hypothetical protein [Stutzerimonas stutzeri]